MDSHFPLHPQALSRLYLHAIMPCLVELVGFSAAARDEARQIKGTVQMRILRGPSVALHFHDGRVEALRERVKNPLIDLVFLSDAHLNNYCAGSKWQVPLVPRGWFRLAEIQAFSRLSDWLERHLKPSPELFVDAEHRRLYTRLTFTAMARGLPPLAQFDEQVRRDLHRVPRGLAQFTMASEDLSLWMETRAEGVAADLGRPARKADVVLDFGSVETAFLAMQDRLDTQAALGLGEMRLTGLIPLADELNVVLDRMRDYLEPA